MKRVTCNLPSLLISFWLSWMILMKMNCIIFFLFILTSYNGIIKAWDDIDFQLFDMVEDIKMNFYDVLEVEKVSC